MKYINLTSNAMEFVVELLFSLESSDLVKDLLENIDTVVITEDNEIQSKEQKLVVNCKNLKELAESKYVSAEEFNTLVVYRFCESIKLYKNLSGKSEGSSLSLRLTDYQNVVRYELASISLSKLFNTENESDAMDKFNHFKKLLLMQDRLDDDTIIDVRQDALKRLCGTLQDEHVIKKDSNISKSSPADPLSKNNDVITDSDTLHFLQIPHHLVTKAEAKDRIFDSLKPGTKNYDKYIKPLIENPDLPEEPVILSHAEERYHFDNFNQLPILGNCSDFNDYMGLIDGYVSSDKKSKDTFRKMFEPRTHDIFNKYTAKDIKEARSKKKQSDFTNSHGLIAHCYWALNQEDSAFKTLRKMEEKNNITDYLDTLIRYYIFIEEELLSKVLINFASYNYDQREDTFAELIRAEYKMNDPLSDHYQRASYEAQHKKLSKKVENSRASDADILEYGENVIKIHFNYDILLYVIKIYLFAISRHERIIEKYRKK